MAVAYYERLVQEDMEFGTSTTTKRNPGGGTLVGTQVGIHSLAMGQAKTSATWNPAAVAAGSSVSTTVTVSGATLGDLTAASFSLSLQGLQIGSYVSAANTVTVTLYNLTGAAVDLASGTLSVWVFQSR